MVILEFAPSTYTYRLNHCQSQDCRVTATMRLYLLANRENN